MSLPAMRPQSGSLPPGFLLRLIDRDLTFVQRDGRRLIPGAIVSARCVAMENGGALLHALRTHRIPYLMDPDTAVLAEVSLKHPRAGWVRAMPSAAPIRQLPITLAQLRDEGAMMTFARAVASTQRSAAALSAGYFPIDGRDDPSREVNRRLIAANRTLAAGRPTCGWLEVSLEALRDRDVVRAVADDYCETTYVVLRVAGLRAAAANEDDAFAVLRAVRQLAGIGARVVLDSVGTLGAAALPLGGYAFSGGGSHHRSVPLKLILERAPSSKPLGYEVPMEFREMSRADAIAAVADGSIDWCSESDCDALDESLPKNRRPAAMRMHFVHAADADGRFAAYATAQGLAAELLASPAEGAQAWGGALLRLADDDADAAASSTHSPR